MSGTSFKIPIGEVVVDHRLNPRSRHTYGLGSDVPGYERATISEIAQSMRTQGQLVPCLVEKVEAAIDHRFDGAALPQPFFYRLRAGFRRYEAAKLAGLAELEVKEVDAADSEDAALVENVVRANLTPAEYAHAVARLLKRSDPELTEAGRINSVSGRLGINPLVVGRYARITERVVPRILEMWKRTPGAVSVPELDELANMSDEDQERWFWAKGGEPLPTDPEDRAVLARVLKTKKVRRARALEVLRKMVLAGHYDRLGHEWKSGALSAIACYKSGKLPKG